MKGKKELVRFLFVYVKKKKKKKMQGVWCLVLKATGEVSQPLQDPQWNKFHSSDLGTLNIVAHIHPKSLMFC